VAAKLAGGPDLPPSRTLRQPHAALADLCDGFFDDVAFVDACPRLSSDELPAIARKLLVHRDHMTSVLESHFGRAVALNVLAHEQNATHYTRKITLTLADDPRMVEFGIVRIDLSYVPAAVRDEILARARPLGEILIRHNVLRRISPRWYFRFPAQTPVAQTFGPAGLDAYGRVGTIYCNEEPAIDLLEVVCCDVIA
jgi:chorismate-pyruvate lyase